MTDSTPALVEGREAVVAAWRQVLTGLPQGDARSVVWCIDTDFADWPLDDAGVLDALVQWARPPGRLLRLVGQDFRLAARHHPRFAAWRRDWSHRFEAWQPAQNERLELPGLLLAGSQGFELLDRERWRGRWVRGAADLRALAETCEAIAQRCESAWPATTLGL